MNEINKSILLESQFGGMALCTNEGIRFIVNTKEPYTGAIYAAERFGTCSQVVENAKQISINFPPPTVSSDCGTVIKVFPSSFQHFANVISLLFIILFEENGIQSKYYPLTG